MLHGEVGPIETFNAKAFKMTMAYAWRVKGGVEIHDIDETCLLLCSSKLVTRILSSKGACETLTKGF